MKSLKTILFFVLALNTTAAFADCADKFSELKAVVGKSKCPPLSWVETGADDGKPMNIKMTDNPLKIEISKGGKVWIHSKFQICNESDKLILKFTEKPTLVNADVLPLANSAMKKGAELPVTMTLTNMTLRANMFWTGHFSPASPAKDECE
jgi:hypothetical protein